MDRMRALVSTAIVVVGVTCSGSVTASDTKMDAFVRDVVANNPSLKVEAFRRARTYLRWDLIVGSTLRCRPVRSSKGWKRWFRSGARDDRTSSDFFRCSSIAASAPDVAKRIAAPMWGGADRAGERP